MRIPAVNSQLLLVFLINCAILTVGMGLFPVLPLYASDLGASSTLIGVYLALTYASITFGTLTFGWLAVRFPHRRILAAAGVVGIPTLILMGQVKSVWPLIVLTGVVWFIGGVGLSLASVLTGMIADKTHRGKSFSLMSLSLPLASLIGGTAVGQLITWRGYPLMFAVLGASWVFLPLIAWKLEDCTLAGRRLPGDDRVRVSRMSSAFYIFALVMLLVTVAVNIGRLGTSLSMHALDFSASQVATTATVSGLLTIPVVLLIGPISDRVARRHMLALAFGLIVAGALALVAATQLWHFWLATTLLLVGQAANGALSAALITDFLRPEELIRGLSRINTVSFSAGVLTFATSGYLFGRLGDGPVYVIAAIAGGVAVVLLEWIGRELLPQDALRSVVEDARRITQSRLAVRASHKTKT